MTTTDDTEHAAKFRPPERITRQLLRITTAGSVDDGKSTLIGRLLHDTDSLPLDHLEAVTDEEGVADLAALSDGLRAEREQGITIDVAYRFFSTAGRSYILADTPGHERYTRNMFTGASNAHVAILLVDARAGVLRQTRRHARIAGEQESRRRVRHHRRLHSRIPFVHAVADFRIRRVQLVAQSVT